MKHLPTVKRGGPAAGEAKTGRPGVLHFGGRKPELVTIALLMIAVVAVWPFGNYAVDDEWAFLKSLQHLHDEGNVRILDWNPMSLVGQLFWGLIFTKAGGFTFTAARVSTLALFAVLILSVAGLLRRVGAGQRTGLVALLALAFNPLCFFHGVLYETDIPACAWMMLSLLLLAIGVSGDERRQRLALVGGSLCGVMAFLVRQSGLLVLVALVLYLILYDRRRLRTWVGLLAWLVIPALSIGAFEYWYFQVHGPTLMFRHDSEQIWQHLKSPDFGQLFRTIYKYGVYAGLFALPLLVGLPLQFWRGLKRTRAIILGIVVCYCAAAFLWLALRFHVVFPLLGNKVTPFGFLSPNEVIAGDRPVLWGQPIAWALSIIGTLALIGLVAAGLRQPARTTTPPPINPALRLTAWLGLLQCVYLLLTSAIIFDRHLLMLLPTLLVLVAAWTRNFELRPAAAAPVLCMYALYSVLGTHDVHTFSQAAFNKGESLLDRGASSLSLDAGYAFDGWHTFETWEQERIPRARVSDPWWVRAVMRGIDTRVVVSLSPAIDESGYRAALRPWSMPAPDLHGYQVIETVPYHAWWPPGERALYVLGRPE